MHTPRLLCDGAVVCVCVWRQFDLQPRNRLAMSASPLCFSPPNVICAPPRAFFSVILRHACVMLAFTCFCFRPIVAIVITLCLRSSCFGLPVEGRSLRCSATRLLSLMHSSSRASQCAIHVHN
eukprot:Opistho-2@38043